MPTRIGNLAKPVIRTLPQIKLSNGRASIRLTALWVLVSAVLYYLATEIAWKLCFPDSKVSLFFPPHAVLVSALLLVPARYWWAYTLAAISCHFIATQRAAWPPLYALHCELFDAAKAVLAAGAIRIFIKSPFTLITLRDAILFVLIAVVIVPFGTAFWGAAFTISNHFGTRYWIEWRNLGVSNAVTSIVLVPAILAGVHFFSVRRVKATPARLVEAGFLGAAILAAGAFAFDSRPAGPDNSPAALYSPIPLLIWAALRFGLGGASAATLAITFQAIWGTMHGRGPFLTQTPVENALALQLFLLVTATPLILLAVLVEEERRSRSELHTSQERMTLAADAARLGMWLWDAPLDRFWLSQKCRELFAFPPDVGVTFQAFLQRVHPEDRADAENAVRRAHEERSAYHSEYRLLLPDGTLRHMVATGRVDCDSTNKPLRMLGICIDVSERRKAEDDAREVSGRLINAQEDERKRIARELHDDLSQRLALLSVEMELFGLASSDKTGSAREQLDAMTSQVKELSSEVHRLSYQLHPAKLYQLGLVAAARTFCSEVSLQTGRVVHFEQTKIPRDLDENVALCLYRVIQEAVQNSIRHNDGAAVQVSLFHADKQLRLLITDDGNGFDMNQARHNGGLGLISMRERVRQVKGSILFTSSPGKGTRIEVHVPLLTPVSAL